MSDSLWPHGPQHARLHCPSPTPRACSDLCPSSQWCHPTISSCCPLLLLTSIFPSIRVFSNESVLHIKWPITRASASTSVLSMNIQDWSSLGLIGLISLMSKGFSRVFSNSTVWKHQLFRPQPSLWSNWHPYMTTGKTIALNRWTFVGKVVFLLFNIMSRLS